MVGALEGPILFYDGECGLCARSVRWCLRHDRRGVLRFAPLQGATYAARTSEVRGSSLPNLETVVLSDGDGLHIRSEAALRAMGALGGPWRLCAAAVRAIPRVIRDAVYRFIAARRFAWFGRAEECDLLREEDRARLLP